LLWENTHNLSGGRVIPIDLMEKTSQVARTHSLNIHIDGARIFNAVTASGVAADRYAAVSDTIQFCFSKGLGAPVGSIVCGPPEMIDEIRYLRRRLGGGMRQAGVLAAAARVALAGRDRLIEDHMLARTLGAGLAERFPGSVDPSMVETNMVRVDFAALGLGWPEVEARLDASGIKINPPLAGWWRIVAHRDVDSGDVSRLLRALE
jgi:threonine aldolase